MNKKYVSEMSKEELTKVFHANEKLRQAISDDMIDTEMFYLQEQLDYIKEGLSDWSIGAYNRNYVRIGNHSKFVDGMEELEKSIPVLIDEDNPILEKAIELKEKYWDEEMYTDEYYELEEEFEAAAEELADRLVMRLTRRFDGCYNEEYMLDYFLEFYADSRLDDEYYIQGDDYILYEDVSYTKSYK